MGRFWHILETVDSGDRVKIILVLCCTVIAILAISFFFTYFLFNRWMDYHQFERKREQSLSESPPFKGMTSFSGVRTDE
jgi:hypothetical protein